MHSNSPWSSSAFQTSSLPFDVPLATSLFQETLPDFVHASITPLPLEKPVEPTRTPSTPVGLEERRRSHCTHITTKSREVDTLPSLEEDRPLLGEDAKKFRFYRD